MTIKKMISIYMYNGLSSMYTVPNTCSIDIYAGFIYKLYSSKFSRLLYDSY